jgi:hypothetical protein
MRVLMVCVDVAWCRLGGCGGSVRVIERSRRRRRPVLSVLVDGWHNIFCQEVVGGMSVKLICGPGAFPEVLAMGAVG